MLFFKSLASIGVNREQLANIAGEDIIRIEKKLIAENRLNNSVSKNDIEQIISLLKKFPDVVQIITSYECLYSILADEEAEKLDTIRTHSNGELEKIRYVIANYFNDGLAAYINQSLNSGNWNNLRVLLDYRIFLTTALMETLVQKLTGKLQYALALLGQTAAEKDLKKKIPYLAEKDFFTLLSEIDTAYFLKYMYALVAYINKTPRLVSKSGFFTEMINAMSYYKSTDKKLWGLIAHINSNYIAHSRQQRFGARLGVGFFLTVVSLCIYIGSRPQHYQPKNNPWMVENHDGLQQFDYNREEQKRQMESFVEARLYPLFYPLNSWKAPTITILKYNNPFSSGVFKRGNADITAGGQSISIFNKTEKECIVLAYVVKLSEQDEVPMAEIYPLYLPKNDSIKLDAKMYLLRFYMGKDLRSFNTYKSYVYPDSADVKFTNYKRIDSMLFSQGFAFENAEKNLKALHSVIITQPAPDIYEISWDGDSPLYKWIDWMDLIMHLEKDSATKTVPLIFDLKHPPTPNKNSPLPVPDSFLN